MDIPRPHKGDCEENRSPYRQFQPRFGRAAIRSVHSTPSQVYVRVDHESKLGRGQISVVRDGEQSVLAYQQDRQDLTNNDREVASTNKND